jgi:hypothetical protein
MIQMTIQISKSKRNIHFFRIDDDRKKMVLSLFVLVTLSLLSSEGNLFSVILTMGMDSWVIGQIAFWYTVHEVRTFVLASSSTLFYPSQLATADYALLTVCLFFYP